MIAVATLFMSSSTVQALDKFPSRALLLVHGGFQPVEDHLALNAWTVINPGAQKMNAYLEAQYQLNDLFKPSLAVGWDFGADEFILTTMLTGKVGDVMYYWAEFDWMPNTNDLYMFVMMDFPMPFAPWLHFGVETESWGNPDLDEGTPTITSYGGGPNMVLAFGNTTMFEFCVHFRRLPDEEGKNQNGYEFFFRTHIILN